MDQEQKPRDQPAILHTSDMHQLHWEIAASIHLNLILGHCFAVVAIKWNITLLKWCLQHLSETWIIQWSVTNNFFCLEIRTEMKTINKRLIINCVQLQESTVLAWQALLMIPPESASDSLTVHLSHLADGFCRTDWTRSIRVLQGESKVDSELLLELETPEGNLNGLFLKVQYVKFLRNPVWRAFCI